MILFIECVVCCILFTLIILPPLYKNPMSMIMSYPPAIIKRVEQLPQYQENIKRTETKHVVKKVFGLVLFAFLLAMVAYCSGCRTFGEVFVHVFLIFFAVNMYDLLVLDWIIFCHSKKLRIPGTEDMDKEYRGKWHHLRGAFIGCGLGLVVSLLSAVLVSIVQIR